MDKTLKLPLFLGAVCLIASAALAGVNALTAPIISQYEEDARNRGYLQALGLESSAGYTMSEVIAAEGDLLDGGITGYVYFIDDADDSLFGAVYNGEVIGWESGIKFQVGISDGKFTGYNNISNNETPSIGGSFIASLDEMIAGVASHDETALNDAISAYIASDLKAAPTFAGVTRGGLVSALLAAGVHYDTLEVPA